MPWLVYLGNWGAGPQMSLLANLSNWGAGP